MQVDTDAFGTPQDGPRENHENTTAGGDTGALGIPGDHAEEGRQTPSADPPDADPFSPAFGGQDGPSFALDPTGAFLSSLPDWVASFLLSPVADVLGSLLVFWLLCSFVVGWVRGDAESVVRSNFRLLGWSLSALLAGFWFPVVLAARATGRELPMAGLGLISLVGESMPQVNNPATAEIEKRQKADPRRSYGTLEHGRQWTPAGAVDAVSVGLAAESGAAKGQTYVNWYIQHHMVNSGENLIVMEAKPNLELSNVVYAHMRPNDLIRELTLQAKDGRSSAVDFSRDPDEIADLAHMLTYDPGSRDPHWNGKAADAIAALLRDAHLPLPQAADAVADREILAEMRERCPRLDNVADEEREWGYIRSTAARVLSPLSSPTVRRVVAGGHPEHPVKSPDYSAQGRRTITILRPDWRSAERTKGIITAVLHAEVMAAVDGGYAGGPGTKVVLDEAASCVRLERLGSYLELARGGRMNVVYVIQSLAQLAAQLGREEAARVWAATEAKIVGATSDVQLASEIARLSGRRNVHYWGPRQPDGAVGGRREHERDAVQAQEITAQQEGEFILIHRGRITKYRVPRSRYHHTQAAPPPAKHPRIAGVAHPAAYAPLRLGRDDQNANRDPDDIV